MELEATLAYKTEAADLQRQPRHLQFQFDMLSSHASTLTQGRRACVGATSVVNGHFTTIDDSLYGRNLQKMVYIWHTQTSANFCLETRPV
ncbi:AUGMIN subunit [Trifolium repens]|nr:AUGMIN subunit [Trifolium repens]